MSAAVFGNAVIGGNQVEPLFSVYNNGRTVYAEAEIAFTPEVWDAGFGFYTPLLTVFGNTLYDASFSLSTYETSPTPGSGDIQFELNWTTAAGVPGGGPIVVHKRPRSQTVGQTLTVRVELTPSTPVDPNDPQNFDVNLDAIIRIWINGAVVYQTTNASAVLSQGNLDTQADYYTVGGVALGFYGFAGAYNNLSFGYCGAPTPTPGEIRYYHADAIGSTRLLTDTTGTVVTRHDFLPFGEEPSAAAVSNVRRFAGKERDVETGFDYFGARYFASGSGRFATVDPALNIEAAVFNPQRWNRYAYAGNNPLRFIDPNGADFWDFVNGLADAIRANMVLGVGRSTEGNRDFRAGQSVGDIASLGMSAYETVVGMGAMGGGAVACGTGIGCLAGVPAIAGGVVATTHAVGMGAAAGVSLMRGTGDGGRGPSSEVTPSTDKSHFESVRGTSARKNRDTGEIWVKDRLHKDHYEVYKNKKDFDNGTRHRAVWEDGRLKQEFK